MTSVARSYSKLIELTPDPDTLRHIGAQAHEDHRLDTAASNRIARLASQKVNRLERGLLVLALRGERL